MRHSQTLGKLLRASRQMQCRTMSRPPPHFQLLPGNAVLNARSQRLCASLLRGEACGEALREVLFAAAEGYLLHREDLFQKAVAIALNGLRDPPDFHNVDPSAYQHEQKFSSLHVSTASPACYQHIPKSLKVTMKILARTSDQVSVLDTDELVEWDLRLTATCADDPHRILRFLTGAVLGCGGWVLSRSLPGSDTVEMSFEFARAASLEIYSVLIAAGLELSRDAHISMTELCQCTKDLMPAKAFDVARVRLLVIAAPLNDGGGKDYQRSTTKPGAPGSRS